MSHFETAQYSGVLLHSQVFPRCHLGSVCLVRSVQSYPSFGSMLFRWRVVVDTAGEEAGHQWVDCKMVASNFYFCRWLLGLIDGGGRFKGP